MTVRETAGKDREQEGVLTVPLHTHQLASIAPCQGPFLPCLLKELMLGKNNFRLQGQLHGAYLQMKS